MVSDPPHRHSQGSWELEGEGLLGSAPSSASGRPPPEPPPSPHRRSLQQVLLLCTGIVVMVLFSLFVD